MIAEYYLDLYFDKRVHFLPLTLRRWIIGTFKRSITNMNFRENGLMINTCMLWFWSRGQRILSCYINFSIYTCVHQMLLSCRSMLKMRAHRHNCMDTCMAISKAYQMIAIDGLWDLIEMFDTISGDSLCIPLCTRLFAGTHKEACLLYINAFIRELLFAMHLVLWDLFAIGILTWMVTCPLMIFACMVAGIHISRLLEKW